VSALTQRQREKFDRDGYVVLEDVGYPDELLDGIVADLDGLYEGEERYVDGVFYAPHRIGEAWRISDRVRSLAVDPGLHAAVEDLYGRKPLPFQTLNFRKGTEQPAHSDTIHFNSMPSGFMCGAWVALEDIDTDNGPVVYYPGSHKLPEITLADVGPDADEMAYSKHVAALIERLDLKPEYATIRKGQTLLWASNLLHGGSPQRDKSRTRYSQVTHFFFEGCKYWTPLLSSRDDIHWRRPEWITAEPVDATAKREANRRARDVVLAAVPAGATVLVASRGDEDIVALEDRNGWHFPRDEQGVWPGHYPADSGEALAHIENLRAQGAQYIAFPESAFWWLDHYEGLAEYLDASCTKLTHEHDKCLVFALPRR
jgi:ectoine hydroxylase-related dioxygenase (phytanoyl-CoA dioxygenase family)